LALSTQSSHVLALLQKGARLALQHLHMMRSQRAQRQQVPEQIKTSAQQQ
jgi:hypothetical protein